MIKILILSDLHIGKKSRTRDLCPYPEAKDKDEKLVTSFFEAARKYISEQGHFDYLIIPGDITNQSNLIEFEAADKFVNQVIQELQILKSKIIFVPGNHDVDWSVLDGKTIYEEEKTLRTRHKYNTLNDRNHFISDLCTPKLTEPPFFRVWEFDNIIYVGFNSSWHDNSLQVNHYGLIDMDQIEYLRKLLLTFDLSEKLKFFVLHHHVFQYPNPHPKWIDISCLQNAQSLIDLLSEFSFNFVIHGHRHIPNFFSSSINNFQTINFFCAGSYSCEMHADIAGSVGNLFHIIEIDDIVKCKGRVLSKAYHSTEYKWINSQPNFGIDYQNNFGSEMSYPEILSKCSEQMEKLLANRVYIEYALLVQAIPDLIYVHNVTKQKLIADLETKYNMKAGAFVDQELIFIKK